MISALLGVVDTLSSRMLREAVRLANTVLNCFQIMQIRSQPGPANTLHVLTSWHCCFLLRKCCTLPRISEATKTIMHLLCSENMSYYHPLFKDTKAGKLTYTANTWDGPHHRLVEKSVNSSPLFHVKSPACPSEITQELFPALPLPGAEQASYCAITKE